MRKILTCFLLTLIILTLVACSNGTPPSAYSLGAVQTFSVQDTLPAVEGKVAHVVLLYGQSNATGVASNAYFAAKSPAEYSAATAGYDNVLINFVTENGNNTSLGRFVKAVPGQGAGADYFGPEVGMANALVAKYHDEPVFIIKYSWGGTILDVQWLDGAYGRGELYNAAMAFTTASLDYLVAKGYVLDLQAVCWMQGESDSVNQAMADRYYENTQKFVGYLRKDLDSYGKNWTFVDAGIAEIEVWSHHDAVNAAKRRYAEENEHCVYFGTHEMGLRTDGEPEGAPDVAHYDSLSAFALGRAFIDNIE